MPIESKIALAWIVTCFPVLKARRGFIVRVLRLELETRRQHLLHKQAGGDGLKRVVHSLSNRRLCGIWFRDKVGKSSARLAGRIARCAR